MERLERTIIGTSSRAGIVLILLALWMVSVSEHFGSGVVQQAAAAPSVVERATATLDDPDDPDDPDEPGRSRGDGTTRTTTERVTRTVETTVTEREVKETSTSIRKAAIFIRSRVPALDNRVGTLQDMVVARLSEDDRFTIISRENVINSVSAFASEGANAGQDWSGDPEKDLDAILSNRASALRLGQLMQADNLLIVSMTSYNNMTRRVEQRGLDERVRVEQLRLQYEVLDTRVGGTLGSAMVSASKTTRLAGFEGEPDFIDDLLDETSEKLAKEFTRRALPANPISAERVEITIRCTIEDLMIPEISRNERGEWVVDKGRYPIELMDVMVEMNGVLEGSAPGTILVEPGLQKIRLSRAGFRDIERTINVKDGMPLNFAMQMTEENRRSMHQDMAFFQSLATDRQLTDAQVEVLEGYAQMLRQSGYRVDIKQDIKVDTDEPIRIEKRIQSFWHNE